MRNIITVAAIALMAACATVPPKQCSTVRVENVGHEVIRVYMDGRRLGMVDVSERRTFKLCHFNRVSVLRAEAIGGPYEIRL